MHLLMKCAFLCLLICFITRTCLSVPHEGHHHEPHEGVFLPTIPNRVVPTTTDEVVNTTTDQVVSDTPTSPQPDDSELTDHRYFLKDIFTKYGHGGQMTFEGFEHLLESLGLGNIIIKDHDLTDHKNSDVFKDTHDTHEHPPMFTHEHSPTKDSHGHISLPLPTHGHDDSTLPSPHSSLKPSVPGHDHHDHGHHPHHQYHEPSSQDSPNAWPEILANITSLMDQHRELAVQDPGKAVKQCLSPLEMFMVYKMDSNTPLDPSTFTHLCPAIVWELEGGHCTHAHHDDEESKDVTSMQWVYSSLAVLIISLCGLFSVAVIPIMQKWFYHTLLQYLVGLAIGSLSGDALLHLMPHSMLGGSEHSHDHGGQDEQETDAVWRGLTALGGIYFFFIAERCLTHLSVHKSIKKERRNSRASRLSRASSVFPPGAMESKNSVGEKLSQYRKGSYVVNNDADTKEVVQMLPDLEDAADTLSCNGVPRKLSTQSSLHEVAFHGRSSFSTEPNVYYHGSIASNNYVVSVSDHHGHGHGHSHEMPQSISAVAWMVIMGDGLHNFCDGLAIGTAFASGIAGGISTAVAVFCHELPHELGDFAMLLKTGMKAKQALLYNGLSSVLCFIGMIIGVCLGNVSSATSWVFAITAGMFLYIALVDMLPELSTPSSDPDSPNASYHLAIQVLGISTGVSIMLLIAHFEHDLKRLVS